MTKSVSFFTFILITVLAGYASAQEAPVVTDPTVTVDPECLRAFTREIDRLRAMSGTCDPAHEAQALENIRQDCAGDFERIGRYLRHLAERCPGVETRVGEITRRDETPRPERRTTTTVTTRTEPFCAFRAEEVRVGGRRRCECPDGLFPVRVERWLARVDIPDLPRPRRGVRVVVIGCANPNDAARLERITEIEREIERLQTLYERLSLRCDQPPDQMPPGLQEICDRFTGIESAVSRHEIQLTTLIERLNELDERVDRLYLDEVPGIAEGACGIPPDELRTLTREQIAERCRSARQRGGDQDLLNVELGVGFRGIARFETGVFSGYGIAFAEWTPQITRGAGFFIRAHLGYGSVGDVPGQFGSVPLGESGIWGVSGGLALWPIEQLTVTVGLAWDSSLVVGTRGPAFGDYRWHNLSLEARVRFNPVDWFFIEGSVGAGWSRAVVESNNRLIDVDGFGLPVGLGLGISF